MGLLEIMKSLWKGVFNFHSGLVRQYAMAGSEKQARVVIANIIASRQGIESWQVLKWMKDNKNSWKIALEIEWTEEN